MDIRSIDPGLIASAVAALVTGAAAITDTRTGHIPNVLTFPVLLLAPPAWLAIGGTGALAQSLLGLFACGMLPYLMFRAGGMGGGDVKLFAGLGALLGMRLGIEVQLAAMVLGAGWAIVKLARRGHFWAMLKNSFYLSTNWFLPASQRHALDSTATDTLRLGAAIFLGTVGVLVWRLGGAA